MKNKSDKPSKRQKFSLRKGLIYMNNLHIYTYVRKRKKSFKEL